MMRILRTAGFAGFAMLATAGQAAQTAQQQQACMTSAEATALVLSVGPGVMRSLVAACTPILPEGAYLRVRGADLAARYAAPATEAKPAAIAAFSKMMGEPLTPEMFDMVADSMVGEMAVGKIKPKDCPKIDRIAALLDPLPPANFAGLVAVIIESASDDDKTASPFRICKPGEG